MRAPIPNNDIKPKMETPTPTSIQSLPLDVLLNVVLHLHPSSLPILTTTCIHLSRTLTASALTFSFAKQHLTVTAQRDLDSASDPDGNPTNLACLNDIPFSHPLLQNYVLAAGSVFPFSIDLLAHIWGPHWATSPSRIIPILSYVFRTRLWLNASDTPTDDGDPDPTLVHAFNATAHLHSLPLHTTLHETHLPRHPRAFHRPELRHFAHTAVSVGFVPGLALIPSHHRLLTRSPRLLLTAIDSRHVDTVALLLAKGLPPTPHALCAAARACHHNDPGTTCDPRSQEILRLLLDVGATPRFALFYAIASGCLDAIRLLVAAGATPTTPHLRHACTRLQPFAAALLLDLGVPPTDDDPHLLHVVLDALDDAPDDPTRRRAAHALIALLLRRAPPKTLPALLTARDAHGLTPLSLACRHTHLSVATHLLALGADPTATCDRGRTALHWLADGFGRSSPKAVAALASRLVAAGCDPAARDGEGETALGVAEGRAVRGRAEAWGRWEAVWGVVGEGGCVEEARRRVEERRGWGSKELWRGRGARGRGGRVAGWAAGLERGVRRASRDDGWEDWEVASDVLDEEWD
ncbi:hypothetical protein HDU96_001517 [Phlyctochytrium bullatum]|nr:hypothetical protein HDU96_001517 [Phlyctochytrium bullatum]